MDLILDVVRGKEGLYKHLFYLGSFNKATRGLPASCGAHKGRRPLSPTAQLRPSLAKQGLCPWVSSSLLVLGWNSNLEEPFLPMTQRQSNTGHLLCVDSDRQRHQLIPRSHGKHSRAGCLKSGKPPRLVLGRLHWARVRPCGCSRHGHLFCVLFPQVQNDDSEVPQAGGKG